ncbi:MAG: sulfotransferase domain-containing protein [Chloroflexota bacterium]
MTIKTQATIARPTTLEEYDAVNARMTLGTKEAKQHLVAFMPLPTDVFITPYGKSGTTWVQQIVHGLRTRGDMDFDDISRVVPWLQLAYDQGIDLNAPQRSEPRAFKSHATWDDIPKGGRYIVPVRNPKDVLVSIYRFLEGWYFEPGSISIETYARERYLPKPDEEIQGYWRHLLSWWPHRHDDNVLMIAYEDMKLDLPRTVRRIATFIGVELDDELFEIVVRQSSLAFMLAHKDRFDDYLIREQSEREGGLPPGSDAAKVRKGEVGSHKVELPAEISAEMDDIWASTIEAQLGFASYDALRLSLQQDIGKT